MLKTNVYAEGKILTGYGCYVVVSAVILALNASVCIADQDFHAFVSAKIWFVAFLYAEVPGIVARGIIAVSLDVVGRDFTYVAEDVGRSRIIVLAEDSFLDEKARETVEFFLQSAIVLRRQMAHQLLRGICGVAGVEALVLHVGQSLLELLSGYIQCIAEINRVEWFDVARDHHHVVGRLVEYDEFAVAVIHQSARRVYGLFQKSICVGRALVCVVVDLQ